MYNARIDEVEDEDRLLNKIEFARPIWLAVNACLMAVTLWMIFVWVPTEANLGIVQRAFYFHVPIAWVAMVAIIVVAIASAMFLATGKRGWDWLALSAAETGVLFASLILITGSIWARPIWNVWWTWDPRLTTTAILWFIFVAYLMLRAYAPAGSQGPRIAAVVGILGAVDAPIIYWTTTLWRTTHPELNIGPVAESGGLSGEMSRTLMVSLVTLTSLFIYMLVERYRVRQSEVILSELGRDIRERAAALRMAPGA